MGKSKSLIYMVRIHGCNECPSAAIDVEDPKYLAKASCACLEEPRSNGRFVKAKTFPKWCPMIPVNKVLKDFGAATDVG